MVYFAVNHHTFDILSLELRRSQEDTAFTLEDLIRLSLGLKRLGISQIDMCDWRTFTAESSLVRENEAILSFEVMQSFTRSTSSFLNCDLLILFFFIQLYSKHVVDTSFDMQSFLSMSNEIYGRNDVYTSQLQYETAYNAEFITRSTFVFDNLLILLVCLYYEQQPDDDVEEIVRLAIDGDYNFFIPCLRITKDTLDSLSLLLRGGETESESEPLQRVLPSSLLDESGFYSVFDLILLIENNISLVPFPEWLNRRLLQREPALFHMLQDRVAEKSESTASQTLYLLRCENCLIEDSNRYSYPFCVVLFCFVLCCFVLL
ncbi:uncharacterized protein [Blastocystis hominis]|uniref:Uncharacterized protein n=1 Tax=Blastocystis hominis TaxID=12968 RepID=D8M9K5_BLAHO|nr:uncharacterized protein [Blastocystis hominis]CBK24744.2 unnamed protein product [Blastocystis hominis]|eukprot:XP_012898792.1 uncharacterized protein [Blastocystis hominis]